MPEKRSNSPKDEPLSELELSDEHLDVSAGATEELFGAYNFLLEVAGVTDQNREVGDRLLLLSPSEPSK